MRLAQQLYEGVDIKGKGTIGLITYLRTDSTRIADEADQAARQYIGETYGDKYVAANEQAGKNNNKIQDAHGGDPSYGHQPDADSGQGVSAEGFIPPLSADLETVCRQPDAAGPYMRPPP